MQPSHHEVVEFYDDPQGAASDRMLCTDGLFYHPHETHPPVAKFTHPDVAEASGEGAANKRDGALIGVFPVVHAEPPADDTLLALGRYVQRDREIDRALTRTSNHNPER